jgi:hypothetical protein
MTERKVYVVVNIRDFSCSLVTLKKEAAALARVSVPTLMKYLNKSGGEATFGNTWVFVRHLYPAKTGKWA